MEPNDKAQQSKSSVIRIGVLSGGERLSNHKKKKKTNKQTTQTHTRNDRKHTHTQQSYRPKFVRTQLDDTRGNVDELDIIDTLILSATKQNVAQ
jgi:hypothetical protein